MAAPAPSSPFVVADCALRADHRAEALGRGDAGKLRLGRLGGRERAVGRAEPQREREALRALGHAGAAVVVDEPQGLEELPAPSRTAAATSAAGTSAPTTSDTSCVAAGSVPIGLGLDRRIGRGEHRIEVEFGDATTRGRSSSSASVGSSSPT